MPRQRTHASGPSPALRHADHVAAGRVFAWMSLALLLPGILFYFSLASSLALGTLLNCVLLIAVGLPAWVGQATRPLRVGALLTSIVVGCIVAVHLALIGTKLPVDFTRGLVSLLPAMALIYGAFELSVRLKNAESGAWVKACRRLLVILTALAFASGFGITLPTQAPFPKPMFPFSEPSHFALVFAPLLLVVCAASGRFVRLVWLAVALGLVAWLQNLTLLVAVLLSMFITLGVVPLTLVVAAGAVALPALDLTYFSDRLNFEGGSENLSYLVFIQGWQLLDDAWSRSGGWGVGFQQLGLVWTDVPVADSIARLADDYLNLLDGGLTGAKLMAEFGVFGVALVVAHAALALRGAWTLRLWATARGEHPHEPPGVALVAWAFVTASLVDVWVRGVGYFAPSTFLMVTAGWVIWSSRRPRHSIRREGALPLRVA